MKRQTPEDHVDAAITKLIRTVGRKAEHADEVLAEQARIAVRRSYQYRKFQLAAVVVTEGDPPGIRQGPQLDFPISQSNVCAEATTLLRGRGAKIIKFAVAHKKTQAEGGEVHNVIPCEGCRSLYLRFFPAVQVVIPHKGETWVVPLRALYPMPYEQMVLGVEALTHFPEDDPVSVAIATMLRSVGREANEMEQGLAREAMIAVERCKINNPSETVFAFGFTAKGDAIAGPQSPFPVGQQACACISVLASHADTGIEMTQLVVASMNGKPHLGVPCGLCRGRFLAHYPNIESIIPFDGKTWVVPMKALLPLLYKTRNGEEQKFTA